MITIELSENTKDKLDEFGKICEIDTEHLPFTGDIELVIRYTKEEKEKLAKEVARVIFERRKALYANFNELEKIKILKNLELQALEEAEDFCETYNMTEKGISFKHAEIGEHFMPFNSRILEFKDAKKDIRIVKMGRHTHDPMVFQSVLEMFRLIFGVLAFLQMKKEHIPREKKVVGAKNTTKKPNKPNKNKQKTYIYNYKYDLREKAFNNAVVSGLPKTEHTEKRDYNYSLNGWYQRGHWRTYKNGKRVWIKPCFKSPSQASQNKKNLDKIYKITKV